MPKATADSSAKSGGTMLTEHPSGDNRFKLLEATIKRHQYQPDALIEVLHTTQELFGYLAPDLLLYIAHSLRLPPSRAVLPRSITFSCWSQRGHAPASSAWAWRAT